MYEESQKPGPVALGAVAVSGCLGIGVVIVICGLAAQVVVAMASLQVRGMAQSVIGFASDIGDVRGASGESRSSLGVPRAGPTVVLRLGSFERPIETQEPTGSESPGVTPTPIAHTVESGEALSLIADRYGISVQEIMRANDLENPDSIFAGQQLAIPSRR